jgi:hypothetical protein
MTKPGKYAFSACKSREYAAEILTLAETFRDPEDRRMMLKSTNNERRPPQGLKGQLPGLFSPLVARLRLSARATVGRSSKRSRRHG